MDAPTTAVDHKPLILVILSTSTCLYQLTLDSRSADILAVSLK